MGFLKKRIRTLTGILTLCLLSALFPASVYAQETGIGGGQNGKTILTTKIAGHPDDVEDGKGEVELPDGTIVTVEGDSLPDGLLFVVEHIGTEDTSVYDWIAECMEGLGSNFRVYDIYFVDSDGQRYEVTGTIMITISLNGAYKSPVIYYVSQGNDAFKMDSSVKNDKISFATTHNSYYVLAEQETDSDDPGQTGDKTVNDDKTGNTGNAGNTSDDSSKGTGSGSTGSTGAKTGDETNLMLWLLLGGGSAVVMVIFLSVALVGVKQKTKSK